MNGNIYKVAPSITKEEILSVCEFDEIPNFGDVMTYEKFIDAVDSWSIMDYDGTGHIILYDKVVARTSTWLHKKSIYFADRFFVSFNVMHSIFGDDMKIIWFNK